MAYGLKVMLDLAYGLRYIDSAVKAVAYGLRWLSAVAGDLTCKDGRLQARKSVDGRQLKVHGIKHMCVRTTMRSTRWYQFNTSARLNYGTLTQLRLQIALYAFLVQRFNSKSSE